MRVIDHPFTDPFFNLAAEEYLFRHSVETETVCVLWQNRPSVIIGKHQDAASEVNRPFAQAHHILLARRFSGGGAVYHDLGNLNITLIGPLEAAYPRRFTAWLAGFLQRAGIPAVADTRHALYADGLKLSGSAQYVRRNRLLHHATLLFSTDLDRLRQVLDAYPSPEPAPIAGSSARRLFTQSVKSPVGNVSDFGKPGLSLHAFREQLRQAMLTDPTSPLRCPEAVVCSRLERLEIEAIKRLRNEKYANPAWNTPSYPL